MDDAIRGIVREGLTYPRKSAGIGYRVATEHLPACSRECETILPGFEALHVHIQVNGMRAAIELRPAKHAIGVQCIAKLRNQNGGNLVPQRCRPAFMFQYPHSGIGFFFYQLHSIDEFRNGYRVDYDPYRIVLRAGSGMIRRNQTVIVGRRRGTPRQLPAQSPERKRIGSWSIRPFAA